MHMEFTKEQTDLFEKLHDSIQRHDRANNDRLTAEIVKNNYFQEFLQWCYQTTGYFPMDDYLNKLPSSTLAAFMEAGKRVSHFYENMRWNIIGFLRYKKLAKQLDYYLDRQAFKELLLMYISAARSSQQFSSAHGMYFPTEYAGTMHELCALHSSEEINTVIMNYLNTNGCGKYTRERIKKVVANLNISEYEKDKILGAIMLIEFTEE